VLTVTAALQMQYVSSGHAVKQTHCEIHHGVGFADFLNACSKFDHDFPLKVVGYSLHWLTAVPQSPVPASAFTNTAGDWQVPYPEYGTAPTTSVLGNPHAC